MELEKEARGAQWRHACVFSCQGQNKDADQ